MNILVLLVILNLSVGFPISDEWSLARNSDLTSSSVTSSGNLSLFFGQVRQSLNLQSYINFVAKVRQNVMKKLEETKKQATMEKLLEEPEYEYVNVYNCSMWQVDNVTAISSVPYGCLWEASVMYAIYIGQKSTFNVTETFGEMDTFKDQYTHYLSAMQDSMYSDWGNWYDSTNAGESYGCAFEKDGNWDIGPVSKCVKGTYKAGNQRALDAQSSIKKKIQNAFIPVHKLGEMCASMSQHWDTTIEIDDLGPVTYGTGMLGVGGGGKGFPALYTIENTTAPKIMSLIPNPMDHMSAENVTDINNLIEFLKNHLFHAPGCDLFDIASPILVFGSAADSITTVRIEGQKAIEVEKKKRKLMILNIVLGIVGVFSLALGPGMAVAIESVVASAGVFGSLAIKGDLTAEDVIFNLVGVFAGCLRGVAKGLKIGEVVNNFKFARIMMSHTGLMKNFSHYTDVMEEIFDLTYS